MRTVAILSCLTLLIVNGCVKVPRPMEPELCLKEYGATLLLYTSPTGVVYVLQGRAASLDDIGTHLSPIGKRYPSFSVFVKITDNTTIADAGILRDFLDRIGLTNVEYGLMAMDSNIVYETVFDPPKPSMRKLVNEIEEITPVQQGAAPLPRDPQPGHSEGAR